MDFIAMSHAACAFTTDGCREAIGAIALLILLGLPVLYAYIWGKYFYTPSDLDNSG